MGQFDRLVTVGRQAHHDDAGLGVEHGGQRLAHGALVVGHQHPDRCRRMVIHRPHH